MKRVKIKFIIHHSSFIISKIMSVEVQALTKTYGTQNAIDAISFTANKGEILGFLGPNGAGKTTTMKILTCFMLPTSGNAKVCGFDVQRDAMEVRRQIGYLPEHNPLYKDMYVREYLNFAAGLHQLDNKAARIKDIIERVGLGLEEKKKIGALSKGYRQRVGLAQAILHNPAVLILDEPTTGLDPNQIIEIRNVIREFGKNKTVIFSTHIMQEVQSLCDRVMIINKGKIVADAPIEDLQKSMRQQNIITVTFQQSVDEKLLQTITGIQRTEKLNDKSYKLFADENADVQAAIFKFSVEHKIILTEMKQDKAGLESIFRELTNP